VLNLMFTNLRHISSLAIASVFLFSSPAHADALDEAIQAEMQRQQIPGLGLAVVKDGKIVREQGYGWANLEHQVAVSEKTIFQSGSVGKQFTAVLVLLLEKDGKLKLNDPVSKYLKNTPARWKNIRIHHLLSHTSGLRDAEEKVNYRKDYRDQDLIRIAASVPLLFQPGEKWSYSNTGYHLLGFICNQVGGKFYGEQLRERIFQPLGMGTRIISERDLVMHRAAGYDVVDGQYKNQDWVSPSLNATADGSLYLTAHDLALWDIGLQGEQILSTSMKQASWTPVKLNKGGSYPYGYGWGMSELKQYTILDHDGAWQGFTTQFSRFVEPGLTIIVLTNRSGASLGRFIDIVAASYLPDLQLEQEQGKPDGKK